MIRNGPFSPVLSLAVASKKSFAVLKESSKLNATP